MDWAASVPDLRKEAEASVQDFQMEVVASAPYYQRKVEAYVPGSQMEEAAHALGFQRVPRDIRMEAVAFGLVEQMEETVVASPLTVHPLPAMPGFQFRSHSSRLEAAH